VLGVKDQGRIESATCQFGRRALGEQCQEMLGDRVAAGRLFDPLSVA